MVLDKLKREKKNNFLYTFSFFRRITFFPLKKKASHLSLRLISQDWHLRNIVHEREADLVFVRAVQPLTSARLNLYLCSLWTRHCCVPCYCLASDSLSVTGVFWAGWSKERTAFRVYKEEQVHKVIWYIPAQKKQARTRCPWESRRSGWVTALGRSQLL